MKVGIIGYGRLGKLITKYMSQDADVIVYEKFPTSHFEEDLKAVGATSSTLKEVCACPIVIPFVPISEFEELLKEIAPLLKEGTLVADVCSVKKYPIDLMEEHLPSHIQILGTHPMFGPDSAAESLFGCKIVVSKVRLNEKLYQDIISYLNTHGLKVIEASPEKHDKEIAHSLLLTHFIGRSLMELEATSLDIDTKGYRRLMKILKTVENDSWQLFQDMNKYNPYAKETREDFINSVQSIDSKVTQ